MNDYQAYIFQAHYSRWDEEEGRRETWDETVTRYVRFFQERMPKEVRESTGTNLYGAILGMHVMPSMRALWTAGKALDRDNAAGYNCSFLNIDDPRSFDEAMYLSMCGTGVGFSVENALVSQMPSVSEHFYPTDTTIYPMDSRIGWSSALRQLISLLYGGLIPKWDFSKLRAKGAPLKTFGGRASGPEPLERLFKFTIATFQRAAGRKLNSLECHDIMCMIGDIVQSGGVRRSAMLRLSDLTDERMRHAKTGNWWTEHAYRSNANNSAVYSERPELGVFMREWLSLYGSRSGESGIFNRAAASLQSKHTGRREFEGIPFGTNPCGEIILRPQGFCNLTEVVVRPSDSLADLEFKVRLAAIMGTLQSTLTDFRYLRKEWKKNAEEERLLGVSLTGIADHTLTRRKDGGKLLNHLKQIAIETNEQWAGMLGINKSAAITCVKPSGTVSQLVDSGSGIHPRYSKYYIRAVREDHISPVAAFMRDSGVPYEQALKAPDVDVFYFPQESPNGSL